MGDTYIHCKGIRVNNLKNIDIDIPHRQFIVVTGLSGSGKSSLAFDTLYAEGQQRYIESLSAYARQFMGKIHKPDADLISGIPPAIAIEQKVNTRNPRSTLGTTTEIYEYIKLLFARLGRTYSPVSGEEVKRDSVKDVCDSIFALPESDRLVLYAPFSVSNGRTQQEQLKLLMQQGYTRVHVQGETLPIADYLQREPVSDEAIRLLIDRFTAERTDENRSRVAESVETAFFEGHGCCTLEIFPAEGEPQSRNFSNRFEKDGILFKKPSANMFSFNTPYGACPQCGGLGNIIGIDPDLVIPDKNRSVYDDAIVCWRTEKMSVFRDALIEAAPKCGFPIHRPINKLSKEEYRLLWTGNAYFKGLDYFFHWLEENAYKIQYRILMSRYKGKTVCPHCHGSRLTKETEYVRIGGKNIQEIIEMPIRKCLDFFQNLTFPTPQEQQIAESLLKEIRTRLGYLCDLGLEYLTLNRPSNTLSGGESQRVNLAGSLGSSLVGSLYILDEPSIGLHSRDSQRLISILKRLRDIGNTVIVVEHDEEIIRAADQIIDTGPYAGHLGGKIVFQGSVPELLQCPDSLTAAYLNGSRRIPVPATRRKARKFITLENVSLHNINNLSVRFPLETLTVISGVSGSGKSTLLKELLYPNLQHAITQRQLPASAQTQELHLKGDIDSIHSVEFVDQNPIGRSSRSNPATYIGAFDYIRQLFAEQPLSKARGYKAGFFSFNVEGGRCEHCQGEGRLKIKMQFMSDIEIPCEECKGKGYKDEALEVKIQEKNIYDILQMTVDEAIGFFGSLSGNKTAELIQNSLRPLQEVGLGYLHLAQSSSSLSGGEAQRIKLAYFLGKGHRQEHTLLIFDEPTTGLHFYDIENLYRTFEALIRQGHSIIVIEHQPDIIKCADWVIEMGPEGGENGGRVIFEGTPEDLCHCPESPTAPFLTQKLAENLK
ncbi:MAG: excinuclease ABC subunit UvrA [Bacteroidales bacterium]|nr:excinuclease ABC subunit UvrA [Bacteroidales bacterium]